MIRTLLLIATGLALMYAASETRASERREAFWREMYRGAEHDANYKQCVEFDNEHVICKGKL